MANKKEQQKQRLRGAYLGGQDQEDLLNQITDVVANKEKFRSMGLAPNLVGPESNSIEETASFGAAGPNQ